MRIGENSSIVFESRNETEIIGYILLKYIKSTNDSDDIKKHAREIAKEMFDNLEKIYMNW